MKRVLIIVLVAVGLVLAALIAPVLLSDPGYVRLEVGRWRVEMSVLVLAGAVLLAWIVLSLLAGLFRLPGRVLRRSREARSRRQLENGFLALTEGDWQRAERLLEKSLSHRQSTAGYLAAARAAQGRGDPSRRDKWLQLADARFGRRHFVTGLARARMMIGDGRVEDAITVLEALHLRKPKHTGVLRYLLESYQDLDRWRDVRLLTPALRRAGVVDRERATELAAIAGAREIESAADFGQLEDAWKDMGKKLRKRRELIIAYARRSAELGRPALSGKVLKRELKHSLDPEMLTLFGNADEAERAARIQQCEQWLENDPDNASLLETLGLLYLEDRQYDKAQSCLERAVRKRPSGDAYAALGRVLDRAGNLEAAAQCYRNALRMKSGRGTEPLPPPG